MPEAAEHVAIGAARQAAWVHSGDEEPPSWTAWTSETYEASPAEFVRARFTEVADMTATVPEDERDSH